MHIHLPVMFLNGMLWLEMKELEEISKDGKDVEIEVAPDGTLLNKGIEDDDDDDDDDD